jgi:hypothetical protein
MAGLYQIRTLDEHAVLVAETDSLDRALQLIEDLHDRTRDQLAANGEGASDLWLACAITTPAGDQVTVGSRSPPTPRRSGAVCGLRSGVAARKDAELVPLWVGKYDPALIALADVGVSST